MKSEYRKKFLENYNKKVLPILEKLEPTRLKMLKQYNHSKNHQCFGLKTPTAIEKDYSKLVKEKCLKDTLECFDFISNMNLNIPINKSAIDSLLNNFKEHIDIPCNRYEDFIFGSYKNIPFIIAEGYNTQRDNVQYYNYLFINIKNNKKTQSKIWVLNKSHYILKNLLLGLCIELFLLVSPFFIGILNYLDSNNIGAFWGAVFQSIPFIIFTGIILLVTIVKIIIEWLKLRNDSKIRLEDPIFTKKYNVLSDNQIEARYLLTTAFMERLNNLKTIFGGQVSCCFDDNNVSFLINNQGSFIHYEQIDAFEISNLQIETTDMTLPNRFFDEMMAITDIIDYFKLDERTGL